MEIGSRVLAENIWLANGLAAAAGKLLRLKTMLGLYKLYGKSRESKLYTCTASRFREKRRVGISREAIFSR